MPGYTVNPGAKAIVNERQGSLNRPINSSRCRIASLEVYRGREQAISINYSGFSLGNGSSLEVSIRVYTKRNLQRNKFNKISWHCVQINTTDLVFDPLDLVGELYRMNISCLDRVESGCMFFKIFGITNISEGQHNTHNMMPCTLSSVFCTATIYYRHFFTAKFDCSVSGTLSYVGCITFVTTNRDMATLSPTSNSPTSVNIVHDLATLSTNSSTLPPTGFFDGILVAVISLVGGMTILIISTVIVVVCVVWFRNTRMGQKSTSHVHVAAQLQNQGISVFKKCYGA